MPLLKVNHQQQQRSSDCLAACAAMALNYLGVQVQYNRLLRLLRVRDAGASFFNLRALEPLGVSVLLAEGDMDQLDTHLADGYPVIASVDTVDLPHWNNESTFHAVVVVGNDVGMIALHDPAFADAPKIVERISFESAWLRREYVYAAIQPHRI